MFCSQTPFSAVFIDIFHLKGDSTTTFVSERGSSVDILINVTLIFVPLDFVVL